jgi:hypothetical protein
MTRLESGHHPVHFVWVELQLDRLPDESVHVTGFGREDWGVLESNEVIMVELMFRHHRFVWMSKSFMPVMILK